MPVGQRGPMLTIRTIAVAWGSGRLLAVGRWVITVPARRLELTRWTAPIEHRAFLIRVFAAARPSPTTPGTTHDASSGTVTLIERDQSRQQT